MLLRFLFFFFFNDTATTEIYTLSLHDALPILGAPPGVPGEGRGGAIGVYTPGVISVVAILVDRKSTRLNSSHVKISYAVFCLKKKKIIKINSCIPHAISLLTSEALDPRGQLHA